MAGENILIIDDSKEIIGFIMAVLRPLGYQISSTENGRDGLARVLNDQPDLVLLDLNLPGMSGISVLEALHQRQFKVPVIMMTFHGSEGVVAQAMRLGARDYITKPFQVDTLLAAIDRVLEEKREAQRVQEVLSIASSAAPSPSPAQPQGKLSLSIFGSASRALASATTQMDLLSRLTEVTQRLAGADLSAVFLLGASQGLITTVIRQGKTFRTDLHIKDNHADVVAQSGQSMWVAGTVVPPGFAAHFRQPVNSSLYAPIQLHKHVLGVIGLSYFQPPGVATSELSAWLDALAQYVGLALENIRLHEAKRKTLPLQTAHEIFSLLTRYLTSPLQTIWKTVYGPKAASTDGTSLLLEREVKKMAIILSVFKEALSPKSAIYIGSAKVADIEKELQVRLASVSQ